MRTVLVVAFLVVIALPLASNLGGRDGADPHAENREMAPPPRLQRSWGALTTFANEFSRWFEDHFGFRSTLVRWYGESRLFWLGVSPSSAVIVGRDRWLFYADDSGLDDYVAQTPFTPDELHDWQTTLIETREWLAARGAAFVFTVAPDKHAVYPEQMPSSIRRIGPTTRTDELLNELRQHTDLTTVDVRPALLRAKARERLYHVTDTHWNDRGAFVAYREIVTAVRVLVPAVPPAWDRSDFTAAERLIEGQDLAGMIGLKRVLTENDLALVPLRPRRARVVEPAGEPPNAEVGRLVTEIAGSTLPRAVIVRDSFASALAPFLSEHFSRAVYLWQNYVDVKTIEDEQPDVVIQEIVGRHLLSVAPYDDVPNAR